LPTVTYTAYGKTASRFEITVSITWTIRSKRRIFMPSFETKVASRGQPAGYNVVEMTEEGL